MAEESQVAGVGRKREATVLTLVNKKKKKIKISHATPSELPLKNRILTRHEVLSPQA